MDISWARPASFCHLGFISDPLIIPMFRNETYDPKGQENKSCTIVKDKETFYRRHTVLVTSCSEVSYVLKGYPLEKACLVRDDVYYSQHNAKNVAIDLGHICNVFSCVC